jgi:glycosyltransferase involved in cell wall biosynthesis
MVAYHFPPLAGSSGVQRTLRLLRQLPEFGWEGLVLAPHPRAYPQTAADLVEEIPDGTVIRRAGAFDAARHLSIGGRYPRLLAIPDRWISWRFDGVRQGLQLIRDFRPQAIWSTYPIATAHVIGAALARRSGLPWIADFRDPMAQEGYPPDRKTWNAFKAIEEEVLALARASLFAAPGAAEAYRQRYPQVADRIGVFENGYDEESFARAEERLAASGVVGPLDPRGPTLLHSGIVYPDERDPRALFEAFGRLVAAQALASPLRLRFRAAVHEGLLHDLAARHGVADRVDILPPVGYEDALQEMLRADGLLVMQAANCNQQIPAKIYEYLRAGRPIVTLADRAGDTARVLAAAGLRSISPLDQADAIERRLAEFASAPGEGTLARQDAVAGCDRRARTRQLAALLDRIA